LSAAKTTTNNSGVMEDSPIAPADSPMRDHRTAMSQQSHAASNASSNAYEGDDDSIDTPSRPPPPETVEEMISLAIQETLPGKIHQTHNLLWSLARSIKAIPGYRAATPKQLKPIVTRWYQLALPHVANKELDDLHLEFVYAFGRVEHPKGSGTMAEAIEAADLSSDPIECEDYTSTLTHRLIKLCRELQRRAGDGPFYLSCGTVQTTFGVDRMKAWRRLGLLRMDGLLEIVESHTKTRATRYRYLGTLE